MRGRKKIIREFTVPEFELFKADTRGEGYANGLLVSREEHRRLREQLKEFSVDMLNQQERECTGRISKMAISTADECRLLVCQKCKPLTVFETPPDSRADDPKYDFSAFHPEDRWYHEDGGQVFACEASAIIERYKLIVPPLRVDMAGRKAGKGSHSREVIRVIVRGWVRIRVVTHGNLIRRIFKRPRANPTKEEQMKTAFSTLTILGMLALCACSTSQLSISLAIVSDATEAATLAVPVLEATGVLPVATGNIILGYTAAVSDAAAQSSAELLTTDTNAVKAQKIIGFFSSVAVPALGPTVGPQVQAIVQAIASAVQLFISQFQTPAAKVAIAANVKLSMSDRHAIGGLQKKFKATALKAGSLIKK